MTCDLFLPVHGGDALAILELEWRWLLGERKVRPVRLTIWGDWFVEDRKTGEVFFLDAGFARLEKAAPSRAKLTEALRDPNKRQQWLLVEHVEVLRRGRILPKLGECYSWSVAPSAGGAVDVNNVDCCPIELHQRISSRVGYLASKLPEGSPFGPDLFQIVTDTLDDPIEAIDARLAGSKGWRWPWVRVAAAVTTLVLGIVGFLR